MEWVGGCGGDGGGTRAQDRGAHLLVMGRAVSWRDEGGREWGQKQKRGGRGTEEREKKGSKNKVSIHKEM